MDPPTFIDLFAGCGGLSLGFLRVGWKGLFAVEKDPMAFHTLFYNLLYRPAEGVRFDWPEWLPPYPYDIRTFQRRFLRQLRHLRGKVTLIVGGLPCQGFSFSGERNKHDPRNKLFIAYLRVVSEIRPRFVLIENVRGILVPHGNGARRTHPGRLAKSYATRVIERLLAMGYFVFEPEEVLAQDYGVPQIRPRVFIVAVDRSFNATRGPNPFRILEELRPTYLREKGLPVENPISVIAAIGDLERKQGTILCQDSESPRGFLEGTVRPSFTRYQHLMRQGLLNGSISGHRFARHDEKTEQRLRKILLECRRGVQLTKKERDELGLRKARIVPLDPDKPALTLTALPDDLIHYQEPRILTVREYARLQSFPDWFNFRGKFTTGGDRRVQECPRYTQIANAVPPLVAEAWGRALMKMYELVGEE
jgi:DNA (cytosine-5)-methyltransferase 1